MNRRALNPDYLLLSITYLLVAVGIFLVFDSSYARAGATARLGHDSFYYLKRQALAAAVGIFLMEWISRRPYWKIRRFAVISVPLSVMLLIACWIPHVRVMFAGAHRWVRIPMFGELQCSEVAKLSLILYLAHLGSADRYRVRTWSGLLPRLAVIGLFAALVVVEPDMGTALCLVGVGIALLMASGARAGQLATCCGGMAALGIMAIVRKGFRVSRIVAFLDPWKHYDKSGYQIVHSLVALGSGGVFGRGLARGVQKFLYLPAGHTDFIYATVGEELGLAGTLAILALFLMFIYRGMAIAHRTRDPFGMLVAVGVSTMVGIQALLNIAVVTGSVPATGVPLPFISFGGTSLILMLVSVGVVVSISKYPDPLESAAAEKEGNEILLSGGGTGGHIYPALSTAEALRPHVERLLFLGSAKGPEGDAVRRAGWEFVGLPAEPLRRSPGALARALIGAGAGLSRAVAVLAAFRPDAVVVTGGYAALAAGLAAGLLRIPLVLEEPNVVPGKTTRLLAPMADLIATGLRGPERRLASGKIMRTGFPVRAGIGEGSRAAAAARWDLRLDRPTVLVYGGSQGARTLNLAIQAALPAWTDANLQVLHGVGRTLFRDDIEGASSRHFPAYRPVPYIEGMADAYSIADLVVCRSGMSSIAEVTVCGKPAVLVPYPHHADRHQIENAREVERTGAGIMIANEDAVAGLPSVVVSLMQDSERLGLMGAAARRIGRPDAALAIAAQVVALAGGGAGGRG